MPMSLEECNALVAKLARQPQFACYREAITEGSKREPIIDGCGSELAISCRKCGIEGAEGCARAYLEAPPVALVLCANRLEEGEAEDALRHELVHAYDICAAKRDLTKCMPLAYSEVRAARESECKKGTISYPFCEWFRESCIRRTAANATRTIFPAEADWCVGEVFKEALADLAPTPSDSGLGPRTPASIPTMTPRADAPNAR
mmetsp:Transcript_15007/g.34661  ORF Transcript_15007/g.34661 Transcript_15007/m.34661 type:complete len:204 (+) Transcript_15007:65-676(+)